MLFWASNCQSEGLRSLYGGEWFLFFIMGRSCRLSKAAWAAILVRMTG